MCRSWSALSATQHTVARKKRLNGAPPGDKMRRAQGNTSLSTRDLAPILTRLRSANSAVARVYTGEAGDRQPVHTVYGGAHLFTSEIAPKLGARALAVLNEFAPDAATFAKALGMGGGSDRVAASIRARVVEKLQREPVEDYRLDFEDGYGNRPDAEEDGHAQSAAEQVARAESQRMLPPFIGIRVKPVSKELHARSLRTLDLFVTTLARALGRRLPPNFVVTIPKVMTPAHVSAVAAVCGALERRLKLQNGTVRLELMIETPQSIIGVDGASALRSLVAAGGGRVRGAHFGTYDYTALCGITASSQHMQHPACDFAKHMMQVSLAQTGVWLSDGSTTIMPVGDRQTVHAAWKRHFEDVTHSLINGFYQGWDLHPAQLPTRYAAIYAFYGAARSAATARLRNFVEKAAQATLVGDVFDDAATGQALLNFFVRGLSSGAITVDEARETGLTQEELQSRSFVNILEARRRA
jgi:citrate lyase beta subunit